MTPTITSRRQRVDCRVASGTLGRKLTLPAMDAKALVKWRGFIAALQGRLGSFNMPIFDCGRRPFAAQV
ncbi:hypothetical protein QEV83_13580 [Methylocapsa sp. D3K7]|uniref:hypothetical protein n=1 Tax=Methylocapsa sp. D3K7 TaxID=3041435 RepID=UPI00244F0238|nr:hypothetical protein [Methylocapsa sp. D3K7]WGJ13711.1 hypothetical protein QEV83_13580 [Methylocapsa sp. D3K7]